MKNKSQTVNKPLTYAQYLEERRPKRKNLRQSLPDFSFVEFSQVDRGKMCRNEIIEEMFSRQDEK